MASNSVVEKFLSDSVILETETIKGPPAIFKYRCKTVGFKKVKLTLAFDGSVNFELIGGEQQSENHLQCNTTIKQPPLFSTSISPFHQSSHRHIKNWT